MQSADEPNVEIALHPSKKPRKERSDKGTRRKMVNAVAATDTGEPRPKSKTRRRKNTEAAEQSINSPESRIVVPEVGEVRQQEQREQREQQPDSERSIKREDPENPEDPEDPENPEEPEDLSENGDNIGVGVIINADMGESVSGHGSAGTCENPVAQSQTGLYPVVGDPNFNELITKKKEFYDARYKNLDDDEEPIEEYAKKMCDANDFELAPHQLFIRNFMSAMTPYNSLLLYHGLGTGKTCSAITVAEEMRDYLTQMGLTKRIIVVASPNVQDNFRLQLFDERKLEQTGPNGVWNLRACTGNKYLREINPTNMQGMTREAVISHVNAIIGAAYKFIGYIQLGRLITKAITGIKNIDSVGNMAPAPAPAVSEAKQIQRIRTRFNNTLLIIDEVHNLRMTNDNKNEGTKKTASLLMLVAKHAQNLRLLLLSGTPMFNSPREVVWLLNLMNVNDNRSTIKESDVFDKDDEILTLTDADKSRSAYSVGKEILKCKSYGYISHVRGENPFTFPYRFYPAVHSPTNSFFSQSDPDQPPDQPDQPPPKLTYPTTQYDGADIRLQKLEFIDVYANPIGEFQERLYQLCIDRMKQVLQPPAASSSSSSEAVPLAPDLAAGEDLPAKFGLRSRRPLQALTMVFPSGGGGSGGGSGSDEVARIAADPGIVFVGETGFDSVMTETMNAKTKTISFAYNTDVCTIPFFKPEHIGTYSHKIANICGHIAASRTGIVLVYSEYIKGGAIPLALALEEMGYGRYNQSKWGRLLKPGPGAGGSGKNYIIVSGDPRLSPDTKTDIIAATDKNNRDGSIVKVIIITKAGSEGLDFKNIRQVHILDPWYNMNLLEQIIGRAVRTCSHRLLEFENRNVSIFMHGTLLSTTPTVEAIDLCLYRYAEDKAVKIGSVSRILKKYAVDCNLNSNYNHMKLKNQKIVQVLSNGARVTHDVAPKVRSDLCDYQDDCKLECGPTAIDMRALTDADVNTDTYDISFLMMNSERIIQRIRELFRERFFYTTDELFKHINIVVTYPESQIYVALDDLLDNPHEVITDFYGRPGHLIHIDDYFLFQPSTIADPNVGIRERAMPLDDNVDYVEYVQNKTDPINKVVPELSPLPPVQRVLLPGDAIDAAAPAAAAAAAPVNVKGLDKSHPVSTVSEVSKVSAVSAELSAYATVLRDIFKLYNTALYHNEIKRREIKNRLEALEGSDASDNPVEINDFKRYSEGNYQILQRMGFDADVIKDAILAHYLDVVAFDDALVLINGIKPHIPRARKPVAAAVNAEFENRIHKYYADERRLIQNGNAYAVILSHASIDAWTNARFMAYLSSNRHSGDEEGDDGDDGDDGDKGAAGRAKMAKAAPPVPSDDLFIFAVTSASDSNEWHTATRSDKDRMTGAIYAYIENLRDGTLNAYAHMQQQQLEQYRQHHMGFYERKRDEANYSFKTMSIELSSGKILNTGRICENDSNKSKFIIPRLRSLLQLHLKLKTESELDAYISQYSDKKWSLCVLTELLLRYYDAISPIDGMRWMLRPCEMQLFNKIKQ